jgi:hypothetical protein
MDILLKVALLTLAAIHIRLAWKKYKEVERQDAEREDVDKYLERLRIEMFEAEKLRDRERPRAQA